jgi:hypothetical protein
MHFLRYCTANKECKMRIYGLCHDFPVSIQMGRISSAVDYFGQTPSHPQRREKGDGGGFTVHILL